MKTNRSLRIFTRPVPGIILAAVFVAILPTPTAAADKPTFEATVDLGNSYIWRGQVLSDKMVMQPGIGGSLGGFSVGAWGNINVDGSDGESAELNEVDYTFSYGRELGRVGIEFGVIDYTFPNTAAPSTTEAYASFEIGGMPVSTGLAVYYDFDEVDGTYSTAFVSKRVHGSAKLTVDVGLSAGWATSDYNASYFGVDKSALNDANAYVSPTLEIGGGLGMSVTAQYTWLPDSEIESAAREIYEHDSGFALLIGLAYSF